ncbi:ferritin-like domain-containing protein [Fluviispira vulneris]|uniref:ferritin-like domain-containing protein n=1 Tax=Fluviispira vulneris TaxID=2763012 RepID=UPI0016479C39|nr:ferritin-like domain-containing protein [Fluviispira vulneris]
MKITGELAMGLAALVQVHATILQQLRVHRNTCKLWGYQKLFDKISSHREDVSDHLDSLILRMLSAEINFDLQNINKLNIGQTVEEIFVSDREMAESCKEVALKLSNIANQNIDVRQLTEKIVLLQTAHINFTGQQLELVRQMGTQLYLATRC